MRALQGHGHTVVEGLFPTSTNSILVTPDGLVGAADPRTHGALAAGY
jgi:gamma-glutamyltranspeptidase/glutathione hydrolase